MKSKLRFIWVVPIALLIITAIPKIIPMDFMVENMTNAGMSHMIVPVVLFCCVLTSRKSQLQTLPL